MDIQLVDLTEADIELIRNWRNSPDVAKYMYTEDQITAEQQKKWFDKVSVSANCKYWVIQYGDKKVGLASLTGIDHTLKSCYWAFYLGDTSVRGAGIGAKTEFNVLSYVFEELNLNKLRCEVFVSNDKVIKMHEKFGFRREAYYREHCVKGNTKLDVVGLAMLKSEWERAKLSLKTRIYGE